MDGYVADRGSANEAHKLSKLKVSLVIDTIRHSYSRSLVSFWLDAQNQNKKAHAMSWWIVVQSVPMARFFFRTLRWISTDMNWLTVFFKSAAVRHNKFMILILFFLCFLVARWDAVTSKRAKRKDKTNIERVKRRTRKGNTGARTHAYKRECRLFLVYFIYLLAMMLVVFFLHMWNKGE